MKKLRCYPLVLSFFIFACAHNPKTDKTPPSQATQNADLKALKTKQSALEFITAAAKGNLDKVKEMIAAGVDINATNSVGVTALMVASFRGYEPVVNFLLDHHASVTNLDGEKANVVQYALLGKNLNVVKAVLKAGAPMNQANQFNLTPLMMAARFSTPEVCQALIDGGAKLETREASGWTAIFFAVARGSADIVNVFLKAKAAVDLVDEDGDTLLSIATENHQADIAKTLLATNKIKIDAVDKAGESSLYEAVREKEFGLVELLCKFGANVNLPRGDGRTPLYEAIDQRDQKIARFLFKTGATLTSKDSEGLDGKEYLLKKDLKMSWLTGS